MHFCVVLFKVVMVTAALICILIHLLRSWVEALWSRLLQHECVCVCLVGEFHHKQLHLNSA